MDSLEIILGKVECLKRDLSAEIVVQAEEGHWEETGGYHEIEHLDWIEVFDSPKSSSYVVDQPRITEPDTEKRELAKMGLQQIYDFSNWYSAKYAAGKAIELPQKVDSDLAEWVNTLSSELTLIFTPNPTEENIIKANKAREDLNCLYEIVEDRLIREYIGDILEKGDKILLDEFQRGTELDKEELKRIYHKKLDKVKPSETDIRVAGKELGYSDLRIWSKLNPLKTAFVGLSAASGIGYTLFDYIFN